MRTNRVGGGTTMREDEKILGEIDPEHYLPV
jgi:hypothetical protein